MASKTATLKPVTSNTSKTNTSTSKTSLPNILSNVGIAVAKASKDLIPSVDQNQAKNQFNADEFMAKINQQNQNFLNAQKQQQPNYDIAGLLKQYQAPAPVDNSSLIKQQYSGALQQLKDAIAASKAKLPGVYNQQRTQANVTGAIGALGDQERLASQGLANSGETESSRIARQTGVGNAINSLNLQQNQANTDLDTQLSNGLYQNQVDLAQALAQNNTGMYNQQAQQYQNNIANILSAIGLQNSINNDIFNQGISEAGLTGKYNGVQTQDSLNAARNYDLNEAGITGIYKGNKTQDALNSDRNYALNEAGLTGIYNGNKTLDAQNQLFNQNLATKQYNQSVNQQKLDNLYRQKTFDYQKSRDTVSDNQWQKEMNLNLRQQSFQEAQQKIENSLAQRRISQEDASQALQWARFNADQDPNSIDNQLKKQQIDTNTQAKITSQVNSTIDNYNNLYTTKKYDKNTGETTLTPNKKSILDALKASVQSGNMSEDIAKQVAGYYGISL